jgi:alpha-mannosidase
MFTAHNISRGMGNFYLYETFSTKNIEIHRGDVLVYDIFSHGKNPHGAAGIDVIWANDNIKPLRDLELRDQGGELVHPATDLKPAAGKWYTRKIPLDKAAGTSATLWNLAAEGDANGDYTYFLDNVAVQHYDGAQEIIYENGVPPHASIFSKEGYSKYVSFLPIDRKRVEPGADLDAAIAKATKQHRYRIDLENLRHDLDLAQIYAERAGRPAGNGVEAAKAVLDAAAADENLTPEKLQSQLQRVRDALDHMHPAMGKFTSHLVGHAHIDFQWLWEWPETIEVCRATFGQAVKFMDEFNDFCFTQSSTALYAATEKNFPELFRKMQKYVAEGRWELAGGRVCEGDEHMISPESHARHFLYGQRYFRERFDGKQAIVGWEPDTFGHTWTMPQILKLGGCKYFNFMRGGHGEQLFWWEAPDGSRVLAFNDDTYNGDIKYGILDELFDFQKSTGASDALAVYGVGNHGGGPTREQIETAQDMQKKPYLPNVKFSTASAFFHALDNVDLTTLTVVRTELNTTHTSGFYGTYTTHADIKRWNREAESVTAAAETIASFASLSGFDYPSAQFRTNWEDILWNHHHDTLPGTSIHPSYNRSEAMYHRVIHSSRQIGQQALAHLASHIKGDDDGVLIFNPLGESRSGIAEIPFPAGNKMGLIGTDGEPVLVQPMSSNPNRALLYAQNIPACGYRRYSTRAEQPAPTSDLTVSEDGTLLENDEIRLRIDPSRGVVSSIYDKKQRRETLARNGSGNRLEVHYEAPNGMSAWVIGPIRRIERLEDPVKPEIIERGPVRVSVRWTRQYRHTAIIQTISLPVHGAPEFQMDTTWLERGSDKEDCPFLKVAFDLPTSDTEVTYEIPFGSIVRPADNIDHPALTWVDASTSDSGAALLNDCKYGYSAEGNVLRLSLIRSTFYPDAFPNDRPQTARWSFMPHAGTWRESNVIAKAHEMNSPLWTMAVGASRGGNLPREQSFLNFDATGIVLTCVKRAEDSKDLVMRVYEALGNPTAGQIRTRWPVASLKEVNFMEDDLKKTNHSLSKVNFRPYEIKNLELISEGKADEPLR